ncbi:5'-nucleotidase C-terminal domain-containing protein, partial [Salinivirga cyanobacteriivorans]
LIALSHLGSNGNENVIGDFQVANQFPYFDLILGGHSHQRIDTTINNVPVFQAGSYLRYLGKIQLSFDDEKITDVTYEEIDLSTINEYDEDIKKLVDEYKAEMDSYLNEELGFTAAFHSKRATGSLMAEAMRVKTQTDLVFQNTGGVRSTIDKGKITRREVFEVDPFFNGMVKYERTVGRIEEFLEQSESGFYYSGVIIKQEKGDVELYDSAHNLLNNNKVLTVGINDYVAAVHDNFFGNDGKFLDYTSSDAIIYYISNSTQAIDFTANHNYFRYDVP